MQQVACPGCGAPVEFKSAASVMAVCGFCKTTLLKDADSVRDLGKMSEVIEDYSPLQIGTTGQFGGRAFSLLGRIQLRYADGFWNEWYAQFDDGTNGWLSDASGQYALTFAKQTNAELPLFEKLVPGRILRALGQAYAISDVRSAKCVAGQGELPFKVGQGWETRAADFRAGDHFLTLDYSEPGHTQVYVGQSVELGDLKAQLLRDPGQISDSAGRFHGKVSALSCPSCGAPVACALGVTMHVVCPSCHAQVDTSGPTAAVLAAGARAEAVQFTLKLGDSSVVGGVRYTVLGAMRRADDEGYSWSEYLLYAPGRRFVWLVETDEGWQRSEVLDRWPEWDGAAHASIDRVNFAQASQYTARVTFAAGSFNWRVSVGDTVRVTEYAAGNMHLAAEVTPEEMTWSRSAPLPLDQVRASAGAHVHADQHPHARYADTARKLVIALLAINCIPLLLATSSALPYALLGAAAIYLPAFFLDKLPADDT
jgi:hypothetical protein